MVNQTRASNQKNNTSASHDVGNVTVSGNITESLKFRKNKKPFIIN